MWMNLSSTRGFFEAGPVRSGPGREQPQRTSQRVTVTSDRDNPRRYLIVAEFDSYEAAMENSNLEETDNLAADMAALLDGPPTFHNLNVLEVYEG